MFSKVLDCPECKHRFNFEHSGDDFPEMITCPECKTSRVYSEYSAMTLCSQCRAKLKIPLDILFDEDLSCPNCGVFLNAHGKFTEDTAASTITNNAADRRQLYKRMLKDGEVFDKYQIIRLLGKGGMAEVYLAEHLLLKQKCAVKLMRANIGGDDEMAVKRFLREAKLSHQFNHPNIVKVFDVGSDFQTGFLFIAMEYVEGKTLHDLAKEQPFTEEQLNAVLVSMANALNELMAVRVVHRDIKPSNIMLTNDGVYKLMDLGIAKSESNSHVAGDMTLTLEQSTIGTPNYASPEQCRSAHNVDYRSDIYSLGATLYHLASGKLPFTGTTAVETILNVMQTEAVPLKSFRPDLSDKMIGLIEQMMRKNPADRPQLPDALLAAIYSSGSGKLKKLKDKFSGKINSASRSVQRLKQIGGMVLVVVLLALSFIYFMRKPETKDNTKTDARLNRFQQQYVLAKNRHPLMAYPDETGSSRVRYRDGKECYPLVTASIASKAAVDIDFGNPESYRQQPAAVKSLVKNKVLDLSGTAANKIHEIKLTDITGDFTLTVNFSSGNEKHTGVLTLGKNLIEIMRFHNSLAIVINDKYYCRTNISVQKNTWCSITLSVDSEKRKITILSGNRLIGAYLLPDALNNFNTVSVGGSLMSKLNSQSGAISSLRLYNKAVNIKMPSGKQWTWGSAPAVTGNSPTDIDYAMDSIAEISSAVSKTAAKAIEVIKQTVNANSVSTANSNASDVTATTGEAPQVQTPESDTAAETQFILRDIPHVPELENDRTVANRLAWCKKRLSILEKAESFPFRQEMLDFVQKQISELTQQQKIVETVRAKLSATSRKNSDTSQFINTAKKYLQVKKEHSSDRWKIEQALREQLNKGKFNVNAEFQEPSNNKSITVADFIYTHNILPKNKLAEFLRERFADVNKMNSLKGYSAADDIFFFGKEDIDSGEQPPMLFSMIRNSRSISSYPEAGNDYVVDLAGKALLLAPKIKDARDRQGRNLMHYAIMADDPEFAKKLIFAGFDQWHEKISGNISCWQFALRSGSARMVSFFRQIGMKDDAGAKDHLQFKLWQAAASRNYAEVENCLKSGADPYIANGRQLNLLQYACSKSDADLVRLLLKLQVDPNQFNRYNSNIFYPNHPLEIALLGCNPEILKLLYDARAHHPITQKVSLLLIIFNRRMYPGADKRLVEYTPEKVIEVFDILLQEKAISPAMLSRNIIMHMRNTFRMPKSDKIKLCEYALKIAPERSLPTIYSHVSPDLAGLVEKYSKKFAGSIPKRVVRSQSHNRRNSSIKKTAPDFTIRIQVGVDHEFSLRLAGNTLKLTSDPRSLSNYHELKDFRGFYSREPECRVRVNSRNRKWDFSKPFEVTDNNSIWNIKDVTIYASSRQSISVHPWKKNDGNQHRDSLVWDSNTLTLWDRSGGAGAYIIEITFSQLFKEPQRSNYMSNHRMITR